MKTKRLPLLGSATALAAVAACVVLTNSNTPAVHAVDNATAQTPGTCDELAQVLDNQRETQRTYDEETGYISVSIDDENYVIDSNDAACSKQHPNVRALIRDVLDVKTRRDKSACAAAAKELAGFSPQARKDPKATFQSPHGRLAVQPYVEYIHQLCGPLGIPVP